MEDKNIETISIAELKQLSTDKEFTSIWNIKKDDTEICKDCEYRYMCVDDRIPVQISTNKYKYSTECDYNPYISKWKDENGYIPVAECGFYDEHGSFIPDNGKIAKLNE